MRGRIAFAFDHQWEQSRNYFDRAIAANPSYPDAYVIGAQQLSIVGNKEAALDQVARGLSLDSHNVFFRSQLGLHLSGLHRFEEALDTYLELPEGFPVKAELLWGLHFRMENYEDAFESVQKLLGPDREASDLLQGTVGSSAEYFDRMTKLAELMEKRSHVTYVSPAFIARVNTHANQHDDASRWLIQAAEDRDSYAPYACMMPEYWKLWQTRGFQTFAEKLALH